MIIYQLNLFVNEKKIEKKQNETEVKLYSNEVNNYVQLAKMDKKEVEKIIEENRTRISDLYTKLINSRGIGIKIDKSGKKYCFVKKDVSDQRIMDFVVLSILNEKVFGIEAEVMLAIASQESNLTFPEEKRYGFGPFQITGGTAKDLYERFERITSCFSKLEILQTKEARDQLKAKLFNGFNPKKMKEDLATQFMLSSLILHSKRITNRGILKFESTNYREIFKRYNGNPKIRERYSIEVEKRVKYLKQDNKKTKKSKIVEIEGGKK